MLKYFIGIIVIASLAFTTWIVNLYNEIKDDVDKIVYYQPKQTTQYFDRNGKLIANYFDGEHRQYVKYDNIPARVIESLVAIEDTQYFEHFGINPDAISRAMIKNIKSGGYVEGASTLTQQLVKLLALNREKKLIRKVKEALLSIRLETILTKEEILERYLNHVYFGHGYYGIKTAAKGYFKKELYELSLKEIAILVGLPRAPSFYDPTKNLKVSLARANQVINRLNSLGWINKDQYEVALTETPVVYNQTRTKNKAPYVVDYVNSILNEQLYDLNTGGYKIKLTIDLEAQEIAREALRKSHEKALQRDMYFRERENDLENDEYVKTLNGALVSLESNTGKVLALVGGIDYKTSMFNRAVQSQRQPGSSIKPFLYLTALNEGYNPSSTLVDISRTYSYKEDGELKKWQPRNYANNFKGLITLRDSLIYSRNLSTINLVTDVGIKKMKNALENYGFKNVPSDLSITLGSISASPLEVAQAYSSLANKGTQVKPYIIDEIITNDGEIIKFEPESRKINTPQQNFLITSVMHDTVKRGTGRNARVKNLDLAGKTGTTNDNVDAWFCGFSPSIQTVVWFGNDDNKPMRKSETGGKIAAPVFKDYYSNLLKIYPELPRKFEKPEDVYITSINNKIEYYTNQSPIPEKILTNVKPKDENKQIEF